MRFRSSRQRRKVMAMYNSNRKRSVRSNGIPESAFQNVTNRIISHRVHNMKPSITSHQYFQKVPSKIIPKKIVKHDTLDRFVLAASLLATAVTANPGFITLYHVYKTARIGIKIANELEKRRFVKRLEMLAEKGAREGIQRIADKKTEEFADRMTDFASRHGLIRVISAHSHFGEDLVQSMFRDTAKNVLDHKVEKVTNFAFEVI